MSASEFAHRLQQATDPYSPIHLVNKFIQTCLNGRFDRLPLTNDKGVCVCEIVFWFVAFDWFPDIPEISDETDIDVLEAKLKKLFKVQRKKV
ncbi:hypothetical protein RFI_06970 [Reticulomyxa filosa]|uniref:Uncharacterized protein n=1 Tax=Reticulomyxa filosa TaxID=46433 RepID=X6NWE3_RETFI|nr:hypothetical protein RFI_06970 [Reticulomyxa filosa]|eukprot:ETO30149.1 hypothetical protein RFI_06970 [Reticulomyxa filosa]